ncbi:MAG: Heimdall-CTERM domain-containing surface protein [Promethearchaeota archaeon]
MGIITKIRSQRKRINWWREYSLSLIIILVMTIASGLASSQYILMSDWYSVGPFLVGSEEDTCPPLVEAAFVPIHVERTEGTFTIDFTVIDDIDPEPDVTAILQVFLPEGWRDWDTIEHEDGSKIKIEIDYDDEEIEIKGPNSEKILNDLINLGGLVIDNGQLLKIELKDDKVEIELIEPQTGKIELEDFEGEPISMVNKLLKVTAVDDAGNLGIATATPSFDDDKIDTCSSPIEFIEEQIVLLENIKSSEAEEEIETAIEYLSMAIEAFKIDLIRCAMNKIRLAVENLIDAQDEDGADTQEVIDNLINWVRCIVDQAMNTAIDLLGEENSHIIEAQEKCGTAFLKIDQGKYDEAITKFKEVYTDLMKELHNYISTLSVSTTDTSATITLRLYRVGFVVCYYGIGTPTYSTEVTSLSRNHEIILTGLIPDSEYSYYLEITFDLEFPDNPGGNTDRYPYDLSYLTFTTTDEMKITTEEPTTKDDSLGLSSSWSISSDLSDNTPGFEIILIIVCLLSGVFLFKRRKKSKQP